jgi:aconitate hydratase/homoaconitate hydratase
MTLTQKILAHHAIGLERPWVQAGDVLQIRVDWTIASELAWNGMEKTWAALGKPRPHDPERFFLAVDHTVDPVTLRSDARAQKLTQLSRDFASATKIRHFYDANVTILHTKFYRDLLLPGQVVIGADSHTSSHGGLGAFAIGLGGADVTAAMVLGQSWIEVPEAIAVDYVGAPPFGMGGKDVILETLRVLQRNTVAMERTVEYRGAAVRDWSTDMRFTIANMTAEFGGLNGIFEPDAVVADWISRRPADGIKGRREPERGDTRPWSEAQPSDPARRAEAHTAHPDDALYFRADDDAPYAARYPIDLAALGPRIARPYAPDNVVPIEEELGRKLDGAFIGACTTTEEELVLAALVLEAMLAAGHAPVAAAEGKRIVVPGDLGIQEHLKQAGLWSIYERAGFAVDPPGCSMCLGIASRKAQKGEHWLSSQNRNFHNRMGEGSHAYLASGATVAASALSMTTTDPRPFFPAVREKFDRLLGRGARALPEVRVSEPQVATVAAGGGGTARSAGEGAAAGVLAGRVQRFGDGVDTDAIIPGEFCHLVKVDELGAKCFHFVRPEFVARCREGRSIIVAGEGWGSGSSREQAVWALQGAGVRAVIARSYAFIHKRNLVNEALPYLVITDPEFYELAQEDAAVEIDFAAGLVRVGGRAFPARGMTPMIRALTAAGGLVPAIQKHGQGVFTALTGGAA